MLGLGTVSLGILGFLLRDRISLLQKKLVDIGFEVEKKEVAKFWQAWIDQQWNAKGRIWKYYVLISLQYLQEPRDETVRTFLLSSNALRIEDGEKIQFNELYHPYRNMCGHPFAAS